MTTKCAVWARVSTVRQHEENQTDVLRRWAADRSLEITAEFITEDSAWQNGNGTKGKEFDISEHQVEQAAVVATEVDRQVAAGGHSVTHGTKHIKTHNPCVTLRHTHPAP